MAENARRALEVRANKPPSERGMTSVGLARARQLINRQTLSPATVRRMLAYFERHEVDKKGKTWSEQGKGWQAWNGWSGDEGWAWARARVRQMDTADKKAIRTHKTAPASGSTFVFKDTRGDYRWLAISSSAYEDRDGEIVSEAALRADVARTDETKEYGPLLWWHIPGAELGTCDFNAMYGRFLVESGTFHDSVVGERLAAKSNELGVSIGFEHLLWEPGRDGIYTWIHREERSLLLKSRASNRFTSLVVKEANMTDEQERHLRSILGDDATGQEAVKRIKLGMEIAEQTAKQEGIRHKEEMEGDDEEKQDGMSDDEKRMCQMIGMAVSEAITPLVEAVEDMKGYEDKNTKQPDELAVLRDEVAALRAQLKEVRETEPLPRALMGAPASTSKTTLVSEEDAQRAKAQMSNAQHPEQIVAGLLFGQNGGV